MSNFWATPAFFISGTMSTEVNKGTLLIEVRVATVHMCKSNSYLQVRTVASLTSLNNVPLLTSVEALPLMKTTGVVENSGHCIYIPLD